jgi:hypothetical protein
MTTFWFILATFTAIVIFVGGLFAAFKAGEESGIAKYGYIEEDEDEISNDDE